MIQSTGSAQSLADSLACDHDYMPGCDTCWLRTLCLPAAFTPEEIALLDDVIEDRHVVEGREYIYQAGQEFTSLFAIISGAVKTYSEDREGAVCVTGCHLPGEIFGFSGIDGVSYAVNAQALERSYICELPFGHLEEVCRVIPELQSNLLHLMSRRIVDYQLHIGQLASRYSARNRVAAFLLSLSTRASRRGESASEIHLPMNGKDIGNYLGIRVETVSRVFSGLVSDGIIARNNREVTILDIQSLRSYVCGKFTEQ